MTTSNEILLEIYREVIDEVTNGVRCIFLENGVENEVLELLKTTWEAKVLEYICATVNVAEDAETDDKGIALGLVILPPDAEQVPTYVVEEQTPNLLRFSREDVNVSDSSIQNGTVAISEDLREDDEVQPKVSPIIVEDLKYNYQPGQVDGTQETSDSESVSTDDKNSEEEDTDTGDPEPPINSDDDITDEEPADAFNTENIIVCQYNQIIRRLNKWRFYFKSGIMTLNGKEYFFDWAYGEGEW